MNTGTEAVRGVTEPAVDLFGEAVATEAPRPEDFYTLYCREALEMPADWRVDQLSVLPEHAPKGFIRITGECAPLKANGHVNWRKAVKGTERTHFVRLADFEAWIEDRGVRLDECPDCRGTGQKWTGWGVDTGHRYKPCARCATAGNYVASPSPSTPDQPALQGEG